MLGSEPGVGGLPETATCRACRYSLRGLGDRGKCPECGARFDAADPASFRVPRRPWWVPWVRPPSARMCALAIAATVVQLVGSSQPGGVLAMLSRLEILSLLAACCVSLCVPGLVILDYSIRLVASLVAWRAGSAPAAGSRAWIVAPMCALLWGTDVLARWPLRLRFGLAESHFKQEAAALLSGTATDDWVKLNKWIGSYYVQSAYVDSSRGAVNFRVERGIVWAGFTYDPNGSQGWEDARVGDGWYSYSHLDSK